ncbi:MAG: ABC transporter ATP-binding protein/permease [Oscillospiraceae bacterium]|jgi:ABC-type multidrug transport system fused ATPase/permease subunit|nr:ABC transporter ATP-binding protein/permease [Oscillospiraceae bacterium]
MKILWRLSRETRGYRAIIAAAVITIILASGVSLIAPNVLTRIITMIQEGVTLADMPAVAKLSVLLLALYAVTQALRAANNILAHKAAWNIVENVRVKVYAKLQTFSTEYFASVHTGDLMSRIVSDTGTLELLYAHIIPQTVSDLLTLVGVTVILFTMNARLAALTCIPIPLLLLSSWVYIKKIRPIFRGRQKVLGTINTRLHDNFDGIKEIRAFGQEKREEAFLHDGFRQFTTITLKGLFRGAFYGPSLVLLGNLGTVIVLGVGGYFSFLGDITPAYVIGFIFYLNLFYSPIMSLAERVEPMQEAIAGAERVVEILDTPPTIVNADGAVPIDTCRGEITFEDVDFYYDAAKPILKNINVEIKPGTFTAFVGPTGVGKSTMVNLAARFYDPIDGRVKLDGVDLRELTLESLRKNIAFVPQDTFLFNMSIAENIAYARPDATEAEIVRAAEIARIHNDILEMPEGYASITGERGVKLSGGQKQRIAIARAVLCGASVLILDEATSSVDAETERMIQHSIDELAGTHTIIAIAHRLSTIINADQICVFHEGEITERGTHAELMERGGLYRRMYELQTEDARD